MEQATSQSELISNFVKSIRDKSNFNSVRMQGDIYFENKYQKKNEFDLGNLMMASYDFSNGNLYDSVNRLEYIIKKEPKFNSAHHFYIQVLIKLNLGIKIEEAIQNAIKYHPEDPLFLNLFGKNLLFNGDKHNALKYLEKAVQKNPYECAFWLDLSFCYFSLLNLKMAQLCLSTAEEINPKHKRCLMLKALLLQEESRYDESLDMYRRAIELYPNDKELIIDMAILYLRIGRKFEGYKLYNLVDTSKRINLYNLIDTAKINHNQNHIEKIQSLDDLNKLHISSKKPYKILIFLEQGFGDVINFYRYLPYLQKKGHSITTIAPKNSIIPLLRCTLDSGKIKFLKKIKYEDIKHFDFKTVVLNLPFILDMTDKPPPPISFNFKKLEKNKEKLIHRLKKLKEKGKVIGVSWKGNKKHLHDESRSINLSLFSKIFKNSKITFLVIDKEISNKDQSFLKKFKNVLLCNNLISDWIDTAIIVSRLDEVITVDTSLAHIAGTLNIPTKIMISKVPDWRWGIKENTTEWYKSVKLLRQKNSGDWESIINNLANKLSSKTKY